MTSLERVLTALRRGQPDRVPYGIGGFNRETLRLFKEKTGTEDVNEYFGVENDIDYVDFKNTNLDLNERFLKYHKVPEGSEYSGTYAPDGTPTGLDGQIKLEVKPGEFYLNELGTGFVVGSNIAYDHFVVPEVIKKTESLKTIEEYPLPDVTEAYRHEHLESDVKKIHDKNLAAVCSMEMTVFESSWQIRGLDELFADFFMNEELAACLLDRITEISCFRAKRFAEAGVDVIRMGDDVGMQDRMMMAPDMWRKWLKPRLAKVIKSAKSAKSDVLVCYHSDGFIEPIIDELNEVGVDILNPLQPASMDPAKIKNLHGDKLAFWGSICVQHTLPFGTPQDVEAEVKKQIETVGKNGGFYLSPTHMIAPEVPHENLFALVEAAKKYGRYDQ